MVMNDGEEVKRSLLAQIPGGVCVCVCSCRDNRVQGGGDTEKIKRGGRERIIRCVLDASFSSLSREDGQTK